MHSYSARFSRSRLYFARLLSNSSFGTASVSFSNCWKLWNSRLGSSRLPLFFFFPANADPPFVAWSLFYKQTGIEG